MPPPDLMLRALHRFLTAYDGQVVHKSATAFTVRVDHDAVVLLQADGDALPAGFAAAVDAARGRVIHAVLFGGSRRTIQKADLGATFAHAGIRSHVAADGKVWSEARWSLHGWLPKALEDLASEPPIRPDTVEAAERPAPVPRDEGGELLPAAANNRPLRATPALVVLLAGVFVLEQRWGGSEYIPTLVRMGALSPEGGVGRVLSASLLHIGSAHLVFNLAALVMSGHVLERVLGPARFVALFAAACIGGAALASFDVAVTAGASTGLWGLMVAEGIFLWRYPGMFSRAYLPGARRTAYGTLAVNVANSFLPGISLLGHLGGGLVGVGLAPLLARGAESGSRAWAGAGAVGSLLLLGGLGWAIATGEPWIFGHAPTWEEREIGGVRLEVPVELGPEEDGGVGWGLASPNMVTARFTPYPPGVTAEQAASAASELGCEDGGGLPRTIPEPTGTSVRLECGEGELRHVIWRRFGALGETHVEVSGWKDAPKEWQPVVDRVVRSAGKAKDALVGDEGSAAASPDE